MPSSERLTEVSEIFCAFTLKPPSSTSLPEPLSVFTANRGDWMLMPASVLVCRLPSPSVVATWIFSALIVIEAPVVFVLKSSPVLMVSFSVSKAFF